MNVNKVCNEIKRCVCFCYTYEDNTNNNNETIFILVVSVVAQLAAGGAVRLHRRESRPDICSREFTPSDTRMWV